jgi:hypothetical protein
MDAVTYAVPVAGVKKSPAPINGQGRQAFERLSKS